jgi:hypothetical protein
MSTGRLGCQRDHLISSTFFSINLLPFGVFVVAAQYITATTKAVFNDPRDGV